jgi:hypothetical protein
MKGETDAWPLKRLGKFLLMNDMFSTKDIRNKGDKDATR